MVNHTPFDFINAASYSKEDLIGNGEDKDQVEKQYVPFLVNKGMSYFSDVILHANEMNMNPHLFKDAQFKYYLAALRKRKRFAKWHKTDKSTDIENIQKHFQCNRTVAKGYIKILTEDQIKTINNKIDATSNL